MSFQERIGLGIILQVDPTGGASFENVAYLVDGIDGPDSKADMVDVTLLSATVKNKAKGQIDAGKLKIKIAYDPSDSSGQTLTALYLQRAPVPSWNITLPAVGSVQSVDCEPFLAHLCSMSGEMMKDKMICRTIELDIIGGLIWAAE